MKTVDEVTLVAGNELSPAPGTPDGTWRTFIFPPTGLLGYREDIEVIGDIIASQIGTAINRPDRVYQFLSTLPDGAALLLEDNPASPNFGLPIGVTDPYLDGLEYSNHVRGVEYLIKGNEWQNDVAGGGWRFTDGRIIEEGMIVTLSFQPQISSVISTPDAVARFLDASGIALVTATSTLTAGSQRKLIFIQGATAVVSVTLDETYPEGVLCAILTASGTQIQTTILAPAGQDIYQNGVKTSFYLGQSEYAYCVRIGTRWYVTSISDGWQRVGDIVMGLVPGANKISANGQTLQRNEVPRLNAKLDELEAALPGSVISVGAWATDNTKWGRDATTIRVPKLGGYFPRFLDLGNAVDADRVTAGAGSISGSKQAWADIEHTHGITDDPDHDIIVRVPGGPGNAGLNNVSGFELITNEHFTDIPNIASGNLSTTETRPVNVAYPALIYI